jgi:hypothetical protein
MKRGNLSSLAACLVLLVSLSGLSVDRASSTEVHPYGYIKLDASYDQARTNDGNFAYFVLDEAQADDEFNMTAKQTRLGLSFQEKDSEGPKVTGRVELDFYGGGAENKPNPMLRHAFMELTYPGFSLLAGQTSDLFAPLNPTTLNYIVLWKSGNTGYRRPQIRLTKTMAMGEKAHLTLAGSLNRTVGMGQSGEDAALPTGMGRIALSTRLVGQKFATIGISGLLGREEVDLLDKTFESEAVAVDFSIPLGVKTYLQGEYYMGQDMASYLGGIGQGIDLAHREEIESNGGWGHLALPLGEHASMNLGAGWDDPELKKGDADNLLDKNLSYFGNIIWTLHAAVSLGVEYLGMETTYADGESYQNHRGQLSFIYRF